MYIGTVARQFGIEDDIIQDRVRKTREESARKARPAREEAVQEVKQADATVEQPEPRVSAIRTGSKEGIMEPSEKELLKFILQHGRTPLQFESDSEFYDPEGQQTVAEFIDAALAGDDAHFVNPDLEATYEAYFALYDEGLDQDAIVLALLNGENRTVAEVTAKYSTEKYELTVHNFSDALTTTDSWLVNYVPRAILVFHTKRLKMRRGEITRMLKEAATPEEMNEQFEKLNQLTEIEKNINIKLGRLKK